MPKSIAGFSSSRQQPSSMLAEISLPLQQVPSVAYTFEVSEYANATVEERNERASAAQERGNAQ